ncbi:hypothetical protein U1Q18_001834 [Sarracenia purpurea var. burkii]
MTEISTTPLPSELVPRCVFSFSQTKPSPSPLPSPSPPSNRRNSPRRRRGPDGSPEAIESAGWRQEEEEEEGHDAEGASARNSSGASSSSFSYLSSQTYGFHYSSVLYGEKTVC